MVVVLAILWSSWIRVVGELVRRQVRLVDTFTEPEVRVSHIRAVVIVERTGTDVLIFQALELWLDSKKL